MGPPAAGLEKLQELFSRIIQLSVGLAFVAMLCVLVYAAIRFLTSGGEPKSIQTASGAITWAILGMLFLVLIWLILKLIDAFTGVDVTNFCFGFKPYCL